MDNEKKKKKIKREERTIKALENIAESLKKITKCVSCDYDGEYSISTFDFSRPRDD